jgi:LPS export ABC transporter protein LptC
MEGGVVIDSRGAGRAPPMQLRTPALTVFPEKNLAQSNQGVVVESAQGVMRAASFELNNATRILQMKQIDATLKSVK